MYYFTPHNFCLHLKQGQVHASCINILISILQIAVMQSNKNLDCHMRTTHGQWLLG